MRSYYERARFLLTTTPQDRLAEFFRTVSERPAPSSPPSHDGAGRAGRETREHAARTHRNRFTRIERSNPTVALPQSIFAALIVAVDEAAQQRAKALFPASARRAREASIANAVPEPPEPRWTAADPLPVHIDPLIDGMNAGSGSQSGPSRADPLPFPISRQRSNRLVSNRNCPRVSLRRADLGSATRFCLQSAWRSL